jgi:signal transduction histidine kinase
LEGDAAKILVSDDGCGMSQDLMEQVFFPFFTTKGVGSGTGLGLSISYGIVKGLGGNIEVESQLGKGTTFIITLPVRNLGLRSGDPPKTRGSNDD